MATSQYIHYFEPDVENESDEMSDDSMDVYHDVPTCHSKYINIRNVVDASFYGNPLTRLKTQKIVDDSVMYKRGKSRAQDYRTIMIEKIPFTSSLFDIIPAIQGDRIISGQILQTTTLTGSLTARIIFREQKYALEFINSTLSNPLSFNGLAACVYLVATPTWPHSPAIDAMGFTQVSSRCVIIRKAPLDFTEHAVRFWLEAEDCTNVETPPMVEKSDTEITIWFASEAAAGRGFHILSKNRCFRDLEIVFCGNEYTTNTNDARSFLGIRSTRNRNKRHSTGNDISGRSKHTNKRPRSEVSRHDMEDSIHLHWADPQPLSSKDVSDAEKLLEALTIVEIQFYLLKRIVGHDIFLMTANELQLRRNGPGRGISLIEVIHKQQQLIDCIDQLSSQLTRMTLVKRTLDNFYKILASAVWLVHEYLLPVFDQRSYMDVFDRARAFKRNTIRQPRPNSTYTDLFANNLLTMKQKLVNLTSSIRNKGPPNDGDGSVLPGVGIKRKGEIVQTVAANGMTSGVPNVNVAEVDEEYEARTSTSRAGYSSITSITTSSSNSSNTTSRRKSCHSWFQNTNPFALKSKLDSKQR